MQNLKGNEMKFLKLGAYIICAESISIIRVNNRNDGLNIEFKNEIPFYYSYKNEIDNKINEQTFEILFNKISDFFNSSMKSFNVDKEIEEITSDLLKSLPYTQYQE